MKIIFGEVFPKAVYVYNGVIDIPIIDTDEFNSMIDNYRIKQGKRPFYIGDDPDLDAWYNIRLIINYECEPLKFQVVTENDEDGDTTTYFFDIDNKEDVKEQIKRELEKYNTTIDEVIKERK